MDLFRRRLARAASAHLDMMVLVAVAIGAGWLYSVYVTLTGGGEVFYEAATVLAAFVRCIVRDAARGGQ